MEIKYKIDYNALTDKVIVDMIIEHPHNEEAAAFLLYNRYDLMLRKVYWEVTDDGRWYDDCIGELFIHLKGKDCSWHNLRSFAWQSTLGSWLRSVARNKFLEILPKLIDNSYNKVSIDNDDPEKPIVQIPDDGVEEYEHRLRRILFLEAVNKLKDDERFVILKRIEGYSSKEIAVLLDKKWKKHNIVKFNNKGEKVIATAEYVDSKAQKARISLKELMINNK